ncbi:MAG TPA: cobalt-precorrin-5B (C(1))-methyltransferase CbiD [Chroococcidiopsis sp.]
MVINSGASDGVPRLSPDLAQTGYTLPVFACAAAIAALRHLHAPEVAVLTVAVDLLTPPQTVDIPIEQVARLSSTTALAICRSDPGDNLDLTRHTPIWVTVESGIAAAPAEEGAARIQITGGDGIGKLSHHGNQPAIYAYARQLLEANLAPWLEGDECIRVTVILPEGKALAERTSNAAFGVVEGLSLLGTSGISQPLSAPGQLEAFRQELQDKAQRFAELVFCIGENGLALAAQLGIDGDRLVKTANWMGPLLVEAGLQGVQTLVLFGYHGKLLKLAGGVFHTHHYVADARAEILTAYCATAGLATEHLQAVAASATAEAALGYLRQLDATTGSQWVAQVYGAIAQRIDQRSQTYIHAHSGRSLQVGTVLFDRDRQIIVQSQTGATFLSQLSQGLLL